MTRRLKWLLLLAIGATLANPAARAGALADYDASLGTLPDAQGFSHFEIVAGDGGAATIAGGTANLEIGDDGGMTILHMKDQLTGDAENLPTFFFERTASQDAALFNGGVRIAMEARNLGGGFLALGFNDSIFETAANIDADKRIGFSLGGFPDDGAYHTVEILGSYDGTNYNFTQSVDGAAPEAMAIQNNTSAPGFQAHFSLQSGSSGGTSAEYHLKTLTLEAIIPEPASFTLTVLALGGAVAVRRRRR